MPELTEQGQAFLLPRYTRTTLVQMAKEHGIDINNINPPKLEVYDQFIDHCATPVGDRLLDERTDTDFAKKYNVSRMALWKWANRKGFNDEVKKRRKAWAQSRVPDVLQALYIGAVKGKRAKEIALFLEYAEGFKSQVIKTRDQEGIEEYTMDDVRKMLSYLPPERRAYFNTLILDIFNEAIEYARRAAETDNGADGGKLPGDTGNIPGPSDQPHASGGPAYQVAEEDS